MDEKNQPKQPQPQRTDLPTIGITLGDFNGIGPEIILKTLAEPQMAKVARFVVYGNHHIFNRYRKLLGLDDFSFNIVQGGSPPTFKKPNLINCWDDDFEVVPGKVDPIAGKAAAISLIEATKDLKAKLLHGVVTAPINKANMPTDIFPYPGHTEFFGEAFGVEKPLMFMVSDRLKVAVATGHIPLGTVPKALTKEGITEKIIALTKSLKADFLINKPRIAILGVNPHAGDEGKIGKEELEIITPLINELKDKAHLVYGPFSADGFFASGQYKSFDAVLAMYHDQGLIPFKMFAFEDGVNFTAGLPIVRTSPDHGTAYDIAGKNKADESSFRASIFTALSIIRNRDVNSGK